MIWYIKLMIRGITVVAATITIILVIKAVWKAFVAALPLILLFLSPFIIARILEWAWEDD